MSDILAVLERYYDAAPRTGADAEDVGPFTLFRSRMPWPYYARPRLGLAAPIGADDVRRLLAHMDAVGVPHEIEWVEQTTPSLAAAVDAAGLAITRYPLLVLDSLREAPLPSGVEVRSVDAEDPLLPAALAVADVGFAAAGTSVGSEGEPERDGRLRDAGLGRQVEAVRRRLPQRPRDPRRRRGRGGGRRGVRAGAPAGRRGRDRRRRDPAGGPPPGASGRR